MFSVLQGPILGLLPFSPYIFNFHRYLKYCSVHHYTDVKLYISFNLNEIEYLNDQVEESVSHNLELNGQKSSNIWAYGDLNLLTAD